MGPGLGQQQQQAGGHSGWRAASARPVSTLGPSPQPLSWNLAWVPLGDLGEAVPALRMAPHLLGGKGYAHGFQLGAVVNRAGVTEAKKRVSGPQNLPLRSVVAKVRWNLAPSMEHSLQDDGAPFWKEGRRANFPESVRLGQPRKASWKRQSGTETCHETQ